MIQLYTVLIYCMKGRANSSALRTPVERRATGGLVRTALPREHLRVDSARGVRDDGAPHASVRARDGRRLHRADDCRWLRGCAAGPAAGGGRVRLLRTRRVAGGVRRGRRVGRRGDRVSGGAALEAFRAAPVRPVRRALTSVRVRPPLEALRASPATGHDACRRDR